MHNKVNTNRCLNRTKSSSSSSFIHDHTGELQMALIIIAKTPATWDKPGTATLLIREMN
jgi:hypothetical protein